MTTPVPRPPFARARVVGSGGMAALLSRAIEARAARELVPEGDDAELVVHVVRRGEAVAPVAAGTLVIVVSESLRAAVSAGAELTPGRYVSAAHPVLSPRLPAQENPEDAFIGRVVAIAAVPGAHAAAHAQPERFWLLLGAVPVTMEPEAHDRRAAITEWLPLLSAAALGRLGARDAAPGTSEELLTAPAFLGATALLVAETGSDPTVAIEHASLTGSAARALASELHAAADLLEAGDVRALESWIEPARSFRRRFPDS